MTVHAETSSGTGILEYCKWETFNATCEPGSVVVMLSAKYGRMRQGRCASTDVFIGCAADVLTQMDARCSGRETCNIVIPDAALHQQQPCPNDIMAYLEASYTCVQGMYCRLPVSCCDQ